MDEGSDPQWALCAVVTEDVLNRLADHGIGDGLTSGEIRRRFELPMLGAVDLGLVMTIVGVRFEMSSRHGDRLAATIRATGAVSFHGDTAMPEMPGLARVRGEVLVRPVVELDEDGSFRAVLDLANSELVGVVLEGIDGSDADSQTQEMMGQMLFAAVGGELFGALASQLDSVGLELDPDQGRHLSEMGVAPGAADVVVGDAVMTVGLRAVPGLDGVATATPVDGRRIGVGVAAGALTSLVNRLVADAMGSPLPFECDVIARESRVGTRIRNRRLVDLPYLPDLRPGLRSTIRPELSHGRLHLRLREAWVELPWVPAPVNRFNRMLGGAAAVTDLGITLPARIALPARQGSEVMVDAEVVELDVGRDGVQLVVELDVERPVDGE
ncbi:MAG: hypothetical protein R2698_08580 [Microthrixaceae bacterium]